MVSDAPMIDAFHNKHLTLFMQMIMQLHNITKEEKKKRENMEEKEHKVYFIFICEKRTCTCIT